MTRQNKTLSPLVAKPNVIVASHQAFLTHEVRFARNRVLLLLREWLPCIPRLTDLFARDIVAALELVDTTSASSLLLNRVRVLVVRFGDALPFAVDLQEKKDVREVDLAAPALFKDAHDGKRFFEFQHVDACLEVLARADGIDVAVELLDAAAPASSSKSSPPCANGHAPAS